MKAIVSQKANEYLHSITTLSSTSQWLLKVQKNTIYSILSLTGRQV